MKKLSREQMKKVMGGDAPLPGNGCFKCCRSNGVCSSCVLSYSGAKCPEEGTTLTSCGNECA